MARYFTDCQEILQNSSIAYDCPTPEEGESSVCCISGCCFVTRKRRDFWQTWYFWFVIILFVLLVLSSFISYLTGYCKRKHHSLIRVRHLSARIHESAPIVTTITGPDGIIQPSMHYNKRSKHAQNESTSVRSNEDKEKEASPIRKHLASPLTPPYSPIKPVTIIRGSAPPLGYRTTSNYTELVLPPGYIQNQANSSHKT